MKNILIISFKVLLFLTISILLTWFLSGYLFFGFQPISTKFPTWGEKSTGIAAVFAVLSALLWFVDKIFSKTKVPKSKIDPKLLIDGEIKTKVPKISTEVIISIINKGNISIDANTLEYVLIIPKNLFYGNPHGAVNNHYGISVLPLPNYTEIRGKVTVKVNPDSQPQKIASFLIKMNKKKKESIKYYFFDSSNVYYPKTVKLDPQWNLPIGKYGNLEIRT